MRVVSSYVLNGVREGLALLGFISVIIKPGEGKLFIRGNKGETFLLKYNEEDLADVFGDKTLNITLRENSYGIEFITPNQTSRIESGIKKGMEFIEIEVSQKDNKNRTHNVKYNSSDEQYDLSFETLEDSSPILREQVRFSKKPKEKKCLDGISSFNDEILIIRGFMNDEKYVERQLKCSFNWQLENGIKEKIVADNRVTINMENGRYPKSIPMANVILFKMMLLNHQTNVDTVAMILRIMRSLFGNRFDEFIKVDSTDGLISSRQLTMPFCDSIFYDDSIDGLVEEGMALLNSGNEKANDDRVRAINFFPK